MRKANRSLCVTAMLLCLLTACMADCENTSGATLGVTSTASAEDCFICGSWDYDPMFNYEGKDSLGIIYWNQLTMRDTQVRVYDGFGAEIFHSGAMWSGGAYFEDTNASIGIFAYPDQGFSDVNVKYSAADCVDLGALKDVLCQDCLDTVAEFYSDQRSHGDENKMGTTGFCLVDFQTRELYTLSEPLRGYKIRDYCVRYSFDESLDKHNRVTSDGTVSVTIFYAPTRSE